MAETIVQRDFFISFNSADLAYAEAIDAALKAAGFTTFFHPNDLPPGGNIPLWMEDALMNSRQMLALCTPQYMADGAVYSEAERYARFWQDTRGAEFKLVPVELKPTQFKPLLSVYKRIDAKGMAPAKAAAAVVGALKGAKEREQRNVLHTAEALPEYFHVLYGRNPNFAGRLKALESLQQSLHEGNVAITAVAGLGGVGKTTLAAEYCHRFGGRYGGVWWVRAEQETTMLADLQALAQRLKLEARESTEADARAALDYLSGRAEPWLLVYDNAPHADALRKWLPVGAVRCIITSRRGDFDSLATVTPLDQWPDEETAKYLLARTGRDDVAGAARLAKALGGLPLAAEQAAAFLRLRKGISFDVYAAQMPSLIKRRRDEGATGDYPDTVYAAFVKSLDALGETEEGKAGLDVLHQCSFLSPDGFDVWLLKVKWAHEVLPGPFAATMADALKREDALAALGALSLLRQEDGPMGPVLVFHRLLLEVVRDWMGEEARGAWGAAAVRLVAGAFPYDPDADPSQWPICARLVPHVAPLEALAPRTGEMGKALDRLLNQSCVYLAARGDREGALAMAQKSVELARLTAKEDPRGLATSLGNLGGRYVDLDRLDDAEAAYREALAIEEPLFAADDPSLAITLSNLAGVYRMRRAFATAKPLLLRAAEVMKTGHGAESAEYGTSLSNLGALYADWADERGELGQRAQAEDYATQALSVTRVARGERHPQTATRYHNLAVTRTKRGDWREAADESGRAVAIMFSLDLVQHPNTLRRLSDLAYCWDQSGQADKAARLRSGDISDLVPIIAQIETEHRAWDAENRHFGPASFFEPKDDEETEMWLSAFAEAGGDVEALMRRLQARELSKDLFARIITEQIARKAE